jgi:branched-subunit amino acid aminotransferase/4-amino-4-deoxychorismate lyase
MPYTHLNHRLLPRHDALISVEDRGFRFGDGVFETLRVMGGVPIDWEAHCQRLAEGLAAIQITYDITPLQSYARQLLHANKVKEGVLRIAITRGVGSKGYLPIAGSPPTLVIETLPLPEIPESITLWQSRYTKISPRALPVAYKLMQGMNSILARMEAEAEGCTEALLCNEAGYLAEGSASNLFWVKHGVLYTPEDSTGLLQGIMRAILLEKGATTGLYTPETLQDAEEVFMTNSLWGVMPVVALAPHGWQWHPGEQTRRYQQIIHDHIHEYLRHHHAAWH